MVSLHCLSVVMVCRYSRYVLNSFAVLLRLFNLIYFYSVFELGADISEIMTQSKKQIKVLTIGNHQSTGDVPLFMYAMSCHPEYTLMWIMSAEFRFTNFGPVSYTHQDYFLSQRNHVKGDLIKHCLGSRDQKKNCYILFPEGKTE